MNQNIDKYNNTLNRLIDLNCANEELEAKNSIIDAFTCLLEKNQLLLDISYSLTNISCSFARNDEMIILGEINDFVNFGNVIYVMNFLLGISLGISILTGIFLVHRYKYKKNPKSPSNKEVNINNDNSTAINNTNNNNSTVINKINNTLFSSSNNITT